MARNSEPDPSRKATADRRAQLTVVLSASAWTLGAILVLIITYPPRWVDPVGRISAALGSLLALVVIALQIARVVAEFRRQPH